TRRREEQLVLAFERRARCAPGARKGEPRGARRFLLVALPRRPERPPQPGELRLQGRIARADVDGGLLEQLLLHEARQGQAERLGTRPGGGRPRTARTGSERGRRAP